MAPKILLVDDSKTIREAMRMTFENTPFSLKSADSGQAGIELLEIFKPDLVLADLRLPDIDGYRLCAKIKEAPGMATVPVLLLNHLGESTDKAQSKAVGALGFFPKPFDTQDLLDQAQMILEDKLAAADDEEEIEMLDLEEVIEVEGEDAEIITTDEIVAESATEQPVSISAAEAAQFLEPFDDDEEDEEIVDHIEIETAGDDDVEVFDEGFDIDDMLEVEDDLGIEEEFGISEEIQEEKILSPADKELQELEKMRHQLLSEVNGDNPAPVEVEKKEIPAAAENEDIFGLSQEAPLEEELPEAEEELEPIDDIDDWISEDMSDEDSLGDEFHIDVEPEETEQMDTIEEVVDMQQAEEELPEADSLAGDKFDLNSMMVTEEVKEKTPLEEVVALKEDISVEESADDIVQLFRRAIREELSQLEASQSKPPVISAEMMREVILPELKGLIKETVCAEIERAMAKVPTPPSLGEIKQALRTEMGLEIRSAVQQLPKPKVETAIDPQMIKDAIAEAMPKTVQAPAAAAPAEAASAPEIDLKTMAAVVRKAIQMEIGNQIGDTAQAVAWEVVPELAQILIKQESERLVKNG